MPLNNPSSALLGPWTLLASLLQNSWTAGPVVPSYAINGAGQVFFRGVVTGGTITAGILLCTLPVGFRPVISPRCPLINYDSGAVNLYPSFVIVGTDGTMTLYKLGTNTTVDLSAVTFFTV